MMVNSYIIHLCTSYVLFFQPEVYQTPGGGASHHHVTYL
jgi:hypothetical protein